MVGVTIQIYNAWTLDCVESLKGHNGKIRSLTWSKDDTFLVSCGTDGAVYCWSMDTLKRENENIIKGCSYTSAVCTSDGFTAFAVGSDQTLRVGS